MRALAVDLDLGRQREGHAVVDPAELLDLVIVPGLLVRELVAGEAEDDESLRAQLLVELLQVVVLGSEAALARRVDDEHRLAGEIGERDLLAVVVREGQVVEGGALSHGSIVPARGPTASRTAPVA